MDNSLNFLWRSFFSGKNAEVLCRAISEVNDHLMHSCQTFCLLNNCDKDNSYLNRIDHNDLSMLLKLPAYRFETIFQNNFSRNMSLTFQQMIWKYLRTTTTLSKDEIEELNSLGHTAAQYEASALILLNARNSNAHTYYDLNDIGHSIMIAGAVLRIFELFDLESVSEEEKDLLRTVVENIVKLSHIGDQPEGYFQAFDNISDANDDLPKISDKKEEYKGNITNLNETSQENTSDENNSDDLEMESSAIINASKDTYERKRQMLLKLRPMILDSKFEYSECIINRLSVKEILSLEIKKVDDLVNVFSIKQLNNKNPEIVKAQIELIRTGFDEAIK